MAIVYNPTTKYYIGLSTDDKTSTGYNIEQTNNIIYYTDTTQWKIYNGTAWVVYTILSDKAASKSITSITTQNLFTVTGTIKILSLVGYIKTGIQTKANNTKLVYTCTGGAAVDLCAVLNVTGSAIRKILTLTGVKADPLALSADEGVVVNAVAMSPIIVVPGILSMNCVDTSTGAIDWHLSYEPLSPGATVV